MANVGEECIASRLGLAVENCARTGARLVMLVQRLNTHPQKRQE